MTKKINKKSQTSKSRIPTFTSYAEEAEWWDTHDITDYLDELKPVKVRFAKNLSEGITIRFDTPSLNKLRLQARDKGIGPTTLARMWILERLRDSKEQYTRSDKKK